MPTYPGLSSEAFRHPLDYQAEQTLRSVPGFDLVAKGFVEYLYERPQRIYFLGNHMQAGPRQYSTLYGIFRECVRDLDVAIEPTLFISQTPQVNAYSLGHEQPSIVVNTGLIDLLEEVEIRTVLAHELGHIKCDHTILIQMAIWVMGAAEILGELTLGLGSAISSGLIFAFYEWLRKAELSADRAALLVADDLTTVMQTMMKLAGGNHKYAHESSLEEFIRQSENYLELDQEGLNQFYKFLMYNGGRGAFLSHPFPVERLHYLREWSGSEAYRQIRQGNYPSSGAEGAIEVDVMERENEELETLRQEIEELQAEIERIRSQRDS
ncbi:M48 family metalloprotease [Lusitaniella coriacea LEGE 07157]|uniref:M48 family metalloprotease n=1 Tax=Lusitaniella coriacea LEGE 07157 TaxID=945747 RepID=A0A8J7ARD0_9CYAN|nr:M48 family metallopeptidase [Lusitaniella coriacea]MBE9114611.1 M48 family metalloprotease [Lusitaniella coriacea LEGE 07157]